MMNVIQNIEAIAGYDTKPEIQMGKNTGLMDRIARAEDGNFRLQYTHIGPRAELGGAVYANGTVFPYSGGLLPDEKRVLVRLFPPDHIVYRTQPSSVLANLDQLLQKLKAQKEEVIIGLRQAHDQLSGATADLQDSVDGFRSRLQRGILEEGNPNEFNILFFDDKNLDLRSQPRLMPVDLKALLDGKAEGMALAFPSGQLRNTLGRESLDLMDNGRKANKMANQVILSARSAMEEVPHVGGMGIRWLEDLTRTSCLVSAFNRHLKTAFPLLLAGVVLALSSSAMASEGEESPESSLGGLSGNFIFRSVLGCIFPTLDTALTCAEIVNLA